MTCTSRHRRLAKSSRVDFAAYPDLERPVRRVGVSATENRRLCTAHFRTCRKRSFSLYALPSQRSVSSRCTAILCEPTMRSISITPCRGASRPVEDTAAHPQRGREARVDRLRQRNTDGRFSGFATRSAPCFRARGLSPHSAWDGTLSACGAFCRAAPSSRRRAPPPPPARTPRRAPRAGGSSGSWRGRAPPCRPAARRRRRSRTAPGGCGRWARSS